MVDELTGQQAAVDKSAKKSRIELGSPEAAGQQQVEDGPAEEHAEGGDRDDGTNLQLHAAAAEVCRKTAAHHGCAGGEQGGPRGARRSVDTAPTSRASSLLLPSALRDFGRASSSLGRRSNPVGRPRYQATLLSRANSSGSRRTEVSCPQDDYV